MQAAEDGAWGWIRDNLTVLLFLAGVALMALVQKLTGYFPSRREFNGLGDRVGTAEKLLMGSQDTLGTHARLIEANAREIGQVREYGSNVSRTLAEKFDRRMGKVEEVLARIDERLKAIQERD